NGESSTTLLAPGRVDLRPRPGPTQGLHPEPPDHAATHPLGERGQIGLVDRSGRYERRRGVAPCIGSSRFEDTVCADARKTSQQGMRGVLANRLRMAKTPKPAAQGQSVSRKTGAEVPLTGLSFGFEADRAFKWHAKCWSTAAFQTICVECDL
ncbi:MAG: hypothetical protein ACKOWG_04825, partial [Planctomycetia bacterium]